MRKPHCIYGCTTPIPHAWGKYSLTESVRVLGGSGYNTTYIHRTSVISLSLSNRGRGPLTVGRPDVLGTPKKGSRKRQPSRRVSGQTRTAKTFYSHARVYNVLRRALRRRTEGRCVYVGTVQRDSFRGRNEIDKTSFSAIPYAYTYVYIYIYVLQRRVFAVRAIFRAKRYFLIPPTRYAFITPRRLKTTSYR